MGEVERRSAWDRLRFAAWLSLGIHLAAFAAMAVVLRHGLATAELVDRLRFLSDHSSLWVGSWLVWNAAALSILYFYLSMAWVHIPELSGRATVFRFAIAITATAVALDLAAEGIYMGVLPGLVGEAPLHPPYDHTAEARLFLLLNRVAEMMTAYAANGLYTIAAIILAWQTRRSYPAWTWLAGLAIGIGGFGLSLAALLASVEGMVLANFALAPCLIAWQAGVALAAGKRASLRSDCILAMP
jgi:hypothetical protein